MGILSGFNSYNKSIVYGIAIVPGETKEAVSKVLQYFFQIMGSTCNYIISDQGKGIESAISDLNEHFFSEEVTHLYDSFHIIKNLKIKKYKYNDILS